jgi:hypothetical protein
MLARPDERCTRAKRKAHLRQEAPADRRALRLAISAFCFSNFSFSARPPAPLPL